MIDLHQLGFEQTAELALFAERLVLLRSAGIDLNQLAIELAVIVAKEAE